MYIVQAAKRIPGVSVRLPVVQYNSVVCTIHYNVTYNVYTHNNVSSSLALNLTTQVHRSVLNLDSKLVGEILGQETC